MICNMTDILNDMIMSRHVPTEIRQDIARDDVECIVTALKSKAAMCEKAYTGAKVDRSHVDATNEEFYALLLDTLQQAIHNRAPVIYIILQCVLDVLVESDVFRLFRKEFLNRFAFEIVDLLYPFLMTMDPKNTSLSTELRTMTIKLLDNIALSMSVKELQMLATGKLCMMEWSAAADNEEQSVQETVEFVQVMSMFSKDPPIIKCICYLIRFITVGPL
ncbi:uncharacterized protein BYT42DRAFT_200078 [Radiomyces spectabilis]|uniref:uncharacterized protein n=1 Tax=Radiomyces spectabilis TaxID=64574 RepID=UPI00221EB591|nr:uncharacterized protein BYT42DRAFT_200078 [Radiomyces spectabilis]KAI8391569.1 hypothetical protein BYT42DRAFT_200078 [Radiomyces spectabilis]